MSLKRAWPHHLLLPLLCLLLLGKLFGGTEVVSVYKNDTQITLPFHEKSSHTSKTQTYTIRFINKLFASSKWHITPDNCVLHIDVNDRAIDIGNIRKGALCNRRDGFVIDLAPYLNTGINTLSILVSDDGVMYGINASTSMLGMPAKQYHALIILSLIATLWAYGLKQAKLEKATVMISTMAALTTIYGLLSTDVKFNAPDIEGHLQYISYVAKNFTLPNPSDGWQYYHAPLYYFITGSISRICELFGLDTILWIRLYALLCLFIFQLFGLKLITEILTLRSARFLVVAAFCFSPIMILIAGRAGNEPMIYPIWAACYFYIWRWVKAYELHNLLKSVALFSLGMLTKTSIIVGIFTLMILVLRALLLREITSGYFLRKSLMYMCLLLACASSVGLGRNLYEKYNGNPQIGWLVGNNHLYKNGKPRPASKLAGHRLNNDWKQFMPGEFDAIINTPFISYRNDSYGRNHFWVTYIKSLTIGEPYNERYFNKMLTNLATVLTITLYVIFVRSLFSLSSVLNRKQRELSFLSICYLTTLIAAVAYRLYFREYSAQNARFTLPIILPLFMLYGIYISRFFTDELTKTRKALACIDLSVLLIYTAISIVFSYGFLVNATSF